ncbi:hypothetical protein B0H17DRAFT_1190348 [Mycena rosella]|uniref:Uncharacterized protein n=1 Tax=Mycena rosella TaxID=1033263 RepID=A0AAD7H2B3_MYCRO|nr:hypothetical protein B0H17DRAFT_1190348 [Mycena rosella]
MLDPTRAVSTSTRHNPSKFDDRSMSNAPYNAIAHTHHFEAPTFMNWFDPRHPLTQRSLPACKRTYFVCSWMLKGSREKGSRRRSYPRPNAPAASLAPLASDLVFEHPSRTCSVPMRIRISSRVRLGTRAALPDSEYFQSVNQCHPESNGWEHADRNPIRPPLSIAACANSTLASGIWPSGPLSYRRHLTARARAGLLQQHDTESDLLSDYRARHHNLHAVDGAPSLYRRPAYATPSLPLRSSAPIVPDDTTAVLPDVTDATAPMPPCPSTLA